MKMHEAKLWWFLLPLAVDAAYVAYLTFWSGMVVGGEFHHNPAYEGSMSTFMYIDLAALILFVLLARRTIGAALLMAAGGVGAAFVVLSYAVAVIEG